MTYLAQELAARDVREDRDRDILKSHFKSPPESSAMRSTVYPQCIHSMETLGPQLPLNAK